MRTSKIMEGVWLALSAICLILGVYASIDAGIGKSYMFFVLFVASVLMFLLRRLRRRQFELNQPDK